MCMSPHEMTSARIEQQAAAIQKMVDDYAAEGDAARASFWAIRVKGLEGVLKQRAEDGTYATAGI